MGVRQSFFLPAAFLLIRTFVGPGNIDEKVEQTGVVGGEVKFFTEAVTAGFHAADGDIHELRNLFGGEVQAQIGGEFQFRRGEVGAILF